MPHFWIVDVDQRALERYRLHDGRYEPAVSAQGDAALTHPDLAGLTIQLTGAVDVRAVTRRPVGRRVAVGGER